MLNEINLYAVDTIIEIGKAFEKQGMKLGSLFIKNNPELKVSKKVLDLHSHDLNHSEGKTTAFCMIDNDEKFHRMWFKLVGYRHEQFDNWKLFKEDIEYKSCE